MDDFKRRDFIKLSALGFATIALQLNSISSFAQQANADFGKWNTNTKLNWDAFLERLTTLAKAQHQVKWNQKEYTDQVKKLLLQCNFPEFENIKKEMDAYENKRPNMFEASSLHNEVDFQVSLFQFEKGEYISHHDHPDMTGVINVVSGNLLAKNYSIEEQLASTREVIKHGRRTIMQECTIREVGNEVITKGDVSILTAHEGNIHSIMPNEFSQLVDVFTPAYKPETNTNWYTVNEDGFYMGRESLFQAEYVNANLSSIDTISLSTSKLDRYVGSYRLGGGRIMKVARIDKQLFLDQSKGGEEPGRKTNLLPYEENKFWLEGQEVRFVFNSEKDNESLTVHFSGTSMTGNKVK